MLNPIMAFSATRRMRSFKTMLIVIAYVAALLLLALAFLVGITALFADPTRTAFPLRRAVRCG